ncbi:hypothetical protein F9K91_19955 [Brucella tritici]|uniref:Uncharacterized protein n=1 Tax=Brucella tritici TaxID=94626 RepID=A0A7X6J9J8_9HYPH|nr:hypothetical protein [Brucella tritici]KAB2663157.1 hypothetical protein F9K91_19955 [Brucella tritici]NKW08987.1 hypothetical protein [Brucella tritici]
MFGLLKALIEFCHSILKIFMERSERAAHSIEKEEESRRSKEQEALQWLNHHLPELENAARDAYSFILKKSSMQVPLEYPAATYPFVEKLSTFPSDDRNAIKVRFQRLRGQESKRAWAKCKSYVELWEKCMSQFCNKAPDFPYDIERFNKAFEVFKTVTGAK